MEELGRELEAFGGQRLAVGRRTLRPGHGARRSDERRTQRGPGRAAPPPGLAAALLMPAAPSAVEAQGYGPHATWRGSAGAQAHALSALSSRASARVGKFTEPTSQILMHFPRYQSATTMQGMRNLDVQRIQAEGPG